MGYKTSNARLLPMENASEMIYRINSWETSEKMSSYILWAFQRYFLKIRTSIGSKVITVIFLAEPWDKLGEFFEGSQIKPFILHCPESCSIHSVIRNRKFFKGSFRKT